MSEFTVVVSVRQAFGNEPGFFNSIEPQAPFVGASKTFSFQCPNVNEGEAAVLMFQTRDVDHGKNVLSINGQDIAGGIPVSPSADTWNGNVMLIAPGVLRSTNRMLVRARNTAGGDNGNLDDFILDNVVVMYKTH
jgi:hypothetical protein